MFWKIIFSLLIAAVFKTAGTALADPAPCVARPALANIRPDPVGVPTQVTINLVVIDIKTIDTAQEAFSVDFFLRLRWQDGRLVDPAQGHSLAACRLPLNAVWHPEVYVYNTEHLVKQFDELVTINPEGQVQYRQRFYGRLSSPLDLHAFPFDTQLLPISLVSLYGPREVAFVFDEATTAVSKWLAPSGWTIEVSTGRVSTLRLERASDAQQFSRFDYEFRVRRELRYYLWKQIVPLSLIVFMSWAVFWIDPSELTPQIGIASTSMLTLIAFLFALGSILPPASYLTRMDHFIYSSVALVFLAFIEAVATCTAAAHGSLARAQRLDRWARWLFPVTFVSLVAVAFWL